MRRPRWIVGAFAVLALAYISLNALRTEGPGSRGVPVGAELPAFAAPLAAVALDDEDANVSDRACTVRGPRALNVCELAEEGSVVLAFFAEPEERCVEQIDRLDRARARFPAVRFAAIAIRGDLDALRRTVRDRGWELPVGWDHDGAVANLYGVAVCPAITFAARGGEVVSTTLGERDDAALAARVGELRPSAAGGARR